ncbi:hypothetical protein V8F33_007923 [Rhypophila sp. PSN 637]
MVFGSNVRDRFWPHRPEFLAAASADAPLTLVWAQPMDGYHVPFLGAYSPEQAETPPTSLFQMKTFGRSPIDDIYPTYTSSAPLDSVMSTQVFYTERRLCRCIIFIYLNGGAQAVGECRVGVDSSKRCLQPTLISFCNTPYPHETRRRTPFTRLQVEFKHGAAETDGKTVTASEAWETRPMRGVAKFYFTRYDHCSFLAVEE